MKMSLFIFWLLVPVGVIAWHYGPGQAQLQRDRAGGPLREARAAAADEDWSRAADLYGAAAKALPEENIADRRRLELAQAHYRMRAGELIQAQEQLEKLLSHLGAAEDRDPDLTESVRHELATTSYFTAWLMRLEGATAEEWKPEAERARQQYRLLAEKVDDEQPERAAAADDRADAFKKNLESTIRLEQMDLSVLMSMPLPKDCPKNCKNLSQRKRKQCQSRCKGEGKGKKKKEGKKDARQEIKKQKGAGLNARGEGGS